MSGTPTIEQASTTPKPPLCLCSSSTGAAQARPRLSELPDSFREPQGIQDALVQSTGSALSVGASIMVLCVISLAAVTAVKEPKGKEPNGIDLGLSRQPIA